MHIRTPVATEDVRIDAGFVSGDEVSSHYDPMIAKLIVRGPDRTSAIQKLAKALEEYEIAGPITNIEFLKRVCRHLAFIEGDVETGFISKHGDVLFYKDNIPSEALAQVALGIVLRDSPRGFGPTGGELGFSSGFQGRQIHLAVGDKINPKDNKEITVDVKQTGNGTFNVQVEGQIFDGVKSSLDGSSAIIRSFFPHTRLDSQLVFDHDKVTVFQQGKQYRLQLAVPRWLENALGVKDLTHSVLAPMPCKILRVEVKEGDEVKKDQPLVVIESMKMETVIRSPQDGVIAKVGHKAGVSAATWCHCTFQGVQTNQSLIGTV